MLFKSFSLSLLLLFLNAVILSAGPLWAGDYILDPKKRLEVPISGTDMTRIYVEGDRIHQVFGLEGRFALEAEENSGQIFIKPTELTTQETLKISLVTEEGVTQDLALRSVPGEAETVCLKRKGSSKKALLPLALRGDKAPSYVKNLLNKIRSVVKEAVPEGFDEVPTQDLFEVKVGGLISRPQKSWQDDTHVLSLYHLSNEGGETLSLAPETFAHETDLAVALGSHRLRPKESTLLVCLRLREDL